MKDYINVIGGGLAGCEAAYQIAKRGIKVKLYEMKPVKFSPAHSNSDLAEVVCSNSFKSNLLTNACGLLKEELRMLDSLLVKCADETSVPAGQALAVDREKFSALVTKYIKDNPYIEIINKEVEEIEDDAITIIATGPLTSEKLSEKILELTGEDKLYFYDAAAPIILKDSIDFNIAFYGDRYSQEKKKDETEEQWRERQKNETKDYINLPMNKEEYERFVEELVNAEVVNLHSFEKKEIFEGCMPIEIMAKRGIDTLRFGKVEIEDERIFEFALPVIGFNNLKKFVILDLNKDSFFKWLQSVEDPSLAFPIISIFSMNVDYTVDLPDNVVEALKITNIESVLVMNIASIPQDNPQGTTINLLAPIVFNLDEKLAGQVILSGSGYDISFPLFKNN